MKYTLIKGHLPSHYDGYDPHHHWEIIALPPALYLQRILPAGSVWPSAAWAELIINPWLHPWVRQHVTCVGYNWLEAVSAEHVGLYSQGINGELHDGIDGSISGSEPEGFVQEVKSLNVNGRGYYGTARIFAIDSDDLLRLDQCWLWHHGKYVRGELRDGRACFEGGLPYRDIAAGFGHSVTWDETARTAAY